MNVLLLSKHQETAQSHPPLILHVIHQFAVGGLENGLVNLINALPTDRYRHAIVALTDYTDFRYRLQKKEVAVFALRKRAGHDLGVYLRFWRVLQTLRPAIVHTRNFPTLEFSVIAALAGVRGRVHGEHGRDVYDLDGSNVKYNLLRRTANLFVNHYVTVSEDLAGWLTSTIGVPQARVTRICNGVDVQRFAPRTGERSILGPPGFMTSHAFVIGSIGRMQIVKDQLTLARAFVRLLACQPAVRDRVRLVMIGDGPLREECQHILQEGHAIDLAWLPGNRDDIPEIVRSLDLFVLPSLAEGISNTILEAMASGVAVLATRVGGNPELVSEGRTGMLVPANDPEAMAQAMSFYVTTPEVAAVQGHKGRARVEARFSLEAMTDKYLAVYDHILGCSGNAPQRCRATRLRSE